MEDKTLKPRNKWLAAFLSIFAPGLGQLYCGSGRRATVFFAIAAGLFLSCAVLAFLLDDLRPAYVTSLFLVPLVLVGIIDAWFLARRKKTISLKTYNKWYVYVAFWALSYLPPFIPSPFIEQFHLPAKSMLPGLIVGDAFQVKKNPFSAEIPERGTVTLFWQPSNPETAYIKRLIGLPGDRVQYKAGRLFLNGEVVRRDLVATPREGRIYRETLPNHRQYLIQEQREDSRMDDTQEYIVPPGHLFFLGDNRDSSQDSRFLNAVGYVPIENLIGTANFIFWSDDTSRVGMLIQ